MTLKWWIKSINEHHNDVNYKTQIGHRSCRISFLFLEYMYMYTPFRKLVSKSLVIVVVVVNKNSPHHNDVARWWLYCNLISLSHDHVTWNNYDRSINMHACILIHPPLMFHWTFSIRSLIVRRDSKWRNASIVDYGLIHWREDLDHGCETFNAYWITMHNQEIRWYSHTL